MNENQFEEIKKGNILEPIKLIIGKICETNDYPTKTRVDLYVRQYEESNEKLNDNSLSKKERKYYKKEKVNALDGLERTDYLNKNYIIKCFGYLALASVSFLKAVQILKDN